MIIEGFELGVGVILVPVILFFAALVILTIANLLP